MIAARPLEILTELCNLPTAPYCEQHVIAWLLGWARERSAISVRRDPAGNVYLEHGVRAGGPPPLVIEAHMDHPGFVVTGVNERGEVKAEFRGGVRPSHFAAARAALWLNDPSAVGTIAPVLAKGRWVPLRVLQHTAAVPGAEFAEVILEAAPAGVEIPVGTMGMWDLPDARVEDGIFAARGCDDVAGVAAGICMLEELLAEGVETPVILMGSRAEEAGFVGAVAAVENGWVPREARVIGLEASKGSAYAPQGGGPIVRVGDKMGVFSPGLTHFVAQAAGSIGDEDGTFRYQRKLMDGGTCNSTVFTAFGYDATGLCMALGNYHNMTVEGELGWGQAPQAGPGIASETIHVEDFAGMVRTLVAAARRYGNYRPGFAAAREWVANRNAEARWRSLYSTSDQGTGGEARS